MAPEGHARFHCLLAKSHAHVAQSSVVHCAGTPPPSWLCEWLMCDKEAIAYCPKYVMTNEL